MPSRVSSWSSTMVTRTAGSPPSGRRRWSWCHPRRRRGRGLRPPAAVPDRVRRQGEHADVEPRSTASRSRCSPASLGDHEVGGPLDQRVRRPSAAPPRGPAGSAIKAGPSPADSRTGGEMPRATPLRSSMHSRVSARARASPALRCLEEREAQLEQVRLRAVVEVPLEPTGLLSARSTMRRRDLVSSRARPASLTRSLACSSPSRT